MNTFLYTNLGTFQNTILKVLIVVPIKIPTSPICLTNIIDTHKLIIASNKGAYLSCTKIPAFDLNVPIDARNPNK